MSKYPQPLEQLIQIFSKFQGVGKKSAERFAFELLNWPQEQTRLLGSLIHHLHQSLQKCARCSSFLLEGEKCSLCDPVLRNLTLLCIISNPKDLYAIEQTRVFNGGYFMIDGLISPLEGRSITEDLIEKLKERIRQDQVAEVILSLDTTVEGDATSLYLKDILDRMNMKITRLAFGVPLGSTLDYVDRLTLQMALKARHPL